MRLQEYFPTRDAGVRMWMRDGCAACARAVYNRCILNL